VTEPIIEATSQPTPEPTPAPTPEPTPGAGDSVQPALDRLADLDALPTHEHVEVYDDVHRRLHGALSDLDAARG
jgi:hypothetical protein